MSRTHHHKEQKYTHVGHDYGARYKCNKSYGAAYGKDSRDRAHSELRAEDKEVVREELAILNTQEPQPEQQPDQP